jgi:hypothetical protein
MRISTNYNYWLPLRRSNTISQSSPLRRVFGAGAIGRGLAARLAQTANAAGTQISTVARGLHLAAIQMTGLRLRQSKEGAQLTTDVRATDDPATLGPQDQDDSEWAAA